VESLQKTGASRYIIDVRGASVGDLDDGVAAARPLIKTGTLSIKQSKDR
jgi:hypothetical protein